MYATLNCPVPTLPVDKYIMELETLDQYLPEAPWLASGMPAIALTTYLMAICEELRRVRPA